MSFNNNQNESALPVPGSNDRKSENLLPKIFRTDSNKKFLSSTLDQLIKPGVVEKVNAFVGRRTAKTYGSTTNENYLPDVTPDRENYQFEPALVGKDELGNVTFYKDYNDYIGQLKNYQSTATNHSNMNSQEFYVWNPHIDFDKFSNYREYYWLPTGPQSVPVYGQSKDIVSTYTVKTVVDDDNTAYIFTPNGFTRNPLLKLYRGQTYRFEVDAKGYGIAFAVSRTYLDTDPTTVNDLGENVSSLYKEGVTSDTEFVETGVIEFTVPENAPDTLYYISEHDVNTSGMISIYNIEENTAIDVENEIIGKKSYKSSNNIEFTNGLKVYFQGNVTPDEYSSGNWYVEGVGDAIKLVPERDLEVPLEFATSVDQPFDAVNFDTYPFEDATGFASEKDYILINRASADRNPWSRYNRWFHRSVIEQSALINNQPLELDQNARASRPIIEFAAGLKLFNHGAVAKETVDLVDTFTTDAFSQVEGSLGYNVDSVELIDNMRVLFAADTDPMVNSKIFVVKFLTHNGKRFITLVETADTTPSEEDVVLVRYGKEYAGAMFFYRNGKWKRSQIKQSVNQHPVFDLYDTNGYSFSDDIIYPSSSFQGNRVFGYKVGSGVVDSELGFSLTYQNISNIGDIVFEFDLLNKTFNYKNNFDDMTTSTDVGFLKKYNHNGTDYSYVSGWIKSNEPSKQYVIRQYNAAANQTDFLIDVYDNSASLNDLEVKVYVNNVNIKNYTLGEKNGLRVVVLNDSLSGGENIVIKTHSFSAKTSNGFYEIPLNFERNPLNDNVNTFTLGEVNDHVKSIIENVSEVSGDFPGVSNLRDVGNLAVYGRKFLQHSGPLDLALYHVTSKTANAIKAVRQARYDYGKFKKQFLKIATESGFHGSAKEHVDEILNIINNDKTSSMPYFSSDMVPYVAGSKTTYVVSDLTTTYYPLEVDFSLDTLSLAATLVYLNEEQLTHEIDYTFVDGFLNVSKQMSEDDVLEIIYYPSTTGSFVPATPTKMGMYPAFVPSMFVDNTYLEPTLVIQGHDGSISVAFGDYRDALLLELEKRIFNNIKVKYDPSILDIHEFVGGKYRKTGFTRDEINRVMITDYSQWLGTVGYPTYNSDEFWDVNNSFTFNYKNSTDLDGEVLSGYWRRIYNEIYDTDRPHSHPWEMLGMFTKPSWWDSVYGPAPYTRDNLILWRDIEQGIIREPGKVPVRNGKYARPGIMRSLPVDESGNLLSPYDSSLAQQLVVYTSNEKFEFGDQSPVETAWKRSGEYPFALIVAWMVLQPAKIFGIGFDRANTVRDNSGNLIYGITGKRITLSNLTFPDKTSAKTLGIVNYIHDYLSDNTTRYSDYINEISTLSNQLAFKVGGFAEKEKLKIILDSRTPLNKGNVFVPNENYDIFLNKSSVLDTVVYSGVMIEKVNDGFIVTGYDKENPVFEFNPAITIQNDPYVTVGGVSESYLEWAPDSEYVIGKVVNYNNTYYRVKVTHRSSSSFDSAKFTKLPELPLVGGRKIQIRTKFENTVSYVLYGTVMKSIQEVVDFLLGYQNKLKKSGFKFEYFNQDTQAIEDWILAAKEFAFWTTQNWDVGSVITLSPAANKLTFSRDYFVVDDIYDPFYNYRILKSDGAPLNQKLLNTVRDNSNQFNLITRGNSTDGIYFVKLPLVQKEHVVVIDNTTVFNDVIYDMVPGYRQERVKVVGYRTDEWNGSLNIPGFVYDQAKVTVWKPWTDYAISDVVKYKEFFYSSNTTHSSSDTFDETNWNRLSEKPVTSLLPNFDYKANQITDFYSLDTDNFDSEQQRLSQHLIGYQKREYLENIINDDVSQYKFYQGFIHEKGTKNALTKLFDALNTSTQDSVEFYEEWALRLGQYGAVETFDEVEFILDESKFRLEPQTAELVDYEDSTRTDLIYQISKNNVLSSTSTYNTTPFPSKYLNKTYTSNSGYVNPEHVTHTVTNYDDLMALDIATLNIGDYVWVLNNKQDWAVYQYVVKPYNLISVTSKNNEYALKFDNNVQLEPGTIFGIFGNSDVLDGFYYADRVELDTIYVVSDVNIASVEFNDSSVAIMTTFENRRYSDFNEANASFVDVYHSNIGKVWIDSGKNSRWGVYENSNVYTTRNYIKPLSGYSNSAYATSFDVDNNNSIIVSGAPSYSTSGAVLVSVRSAESLPSKVVQIIEPEGSLGIGIGYGSSIAISPDGKTLLVGSPYASNVKTQFKDEFVLSTEYDKSDVVTVSGSYWRALNNVSNEEPETSSNWEQVYIVEHSTLGQASGYTDQGVISVYVRDVITGAYNYSTTIVSPAQQTDELFGSTIKLYSYGNTLRALVSAPAKFNGSASHTGRIYLIEYLDGVWKYIDSVQGVNNLENKFSASKNAMTLAVIDSTVNTHGIKRTVDVYHLEDGIYTFAQSFTSTDNLEKFGYSISVNDTGTEIAIGAPYNDDKLLDSGKVYIYTKTNSGYTLTQELVSPSNDYNEMFGAAIDYSENKLVITSKNGDLKTEALFDNGDTYFDKKSTKFITEMLDIGKVYVYELIDSKYMYAESLDYPGVTSTGDVQYYNLDNILINKNHVYVGIPEYNDGEIVGQIVDYRSDIDSTSWSVIEEAVDTVDLTKIKRIYLYNTSTNKILANLDYVDPRQGKIPGPADQGIDFKTMYDPAVYDTSDGSYDVVVDVESAWGPRQVGKIWWDISAAKWMNPYQGNSQYRVSTWNSLIQDSSIDVYEWVESDMLPSEWDKVADTTQGMVKGISGKSLYGDAVYATKPVYNQSNTLVYNLYYYWVVNKKTTPVGANRLSAYAISQFISDPAAIGYRFIALTGNDRFTIYNCKSLIEDRNTVLHISYYKSDYKEGNLHNEYQLVTENLDISKPSLEIEKKWIDSLVGYDLNSKPVPDPTLPVKNRYGTLSTPRQGWFVNRLYALQQVIERTNSVLIDTNVVDGFNLEGLFKKDEIPNIKTGKYDVVVDTYSQLRFAAVAKVVQATVEPVIESGKIVSINITNPGRGYKEPPSFVVSSTTGSGVILQTEIDNLGKVVNVEVVKTGKSYSPDTRILVRKFAALVLSDETADGRWSIFDWEPSTESWNRTAIQSYNTRNYWNYVDWYAPGYSVFSGVSYTVNYSYQLPSISASAGQLVKILNDGSNSWVILEKVSDTDSSDYYKGYKTVAKQNGTIQLSESLYKFKNTIIGFDSNIYDVSSYDKEPVYELRNILETLRDDIFIGDLEVEWNKLFFSSIRYVLSEQNNVDWVFKTSFVRAKHNLGELHQSLTFKNDNLASYEDYINEVKPYSTQVREFISSYQRTEPTNSAVMDFDNPAYFNAESGFIENSNEKLVNGEIANISDKTDQVWLNNTGYTLTSIEVAYPGHGYLSTPEVIVGDGTVKTKVYMQRDKIYHVEILPNNVKFLVPPKITINGNLSDEGKSAKLSAILGNGLVRSLKVGVLFDRVDTKPFYDIEQITHTETFVGSGATTEYILTWPFDLKLGTMEILVDGIEVLRDEYNVENIIDKSKGYTRYCGKLTFTNPPEAEKVISITYVKNILILDAVDRIGLFYKPNYGMPGLDDLSQVMDGIDYSGVNVDSYNFGNDQGFGAGAYGVVPWDTYDSLYEDITIILDGSTVSIDLETPLSEGVVYNLYINKVGTETFIRLDDENYGTAYPVKNVNAVMQSIIGDGSTNVIILDPVLVPTEPGDVIIIRKNTSDGSFKLPESSYDSVYDGGNTAYTSAVGISASDIIVDGDGIVTQATSAGPEELVPGQLFDTLDIRVYTRPSDGCGIISVETHIMKDNIKTYSIPGQPIKKEAILVKINNRILYDTEYTVDYVTNTIDVTASYLKDALLTITTVGSNGSDLVEKTRIIFDGLSYTIPIPIKYSSNLTVITSVNGKVLNYGIEYSVNSTLDGYVGVTVSYDVITAGDVVDLMVFSDYQNSLSQVTIDKTFVSDGIKTVHKFDGTTNPIPFSKPPLSHKVLVKVDDKILKAGYTKKFISGNSLEYLLERWQFGGVNIVESDIMVFVNGVQIDETLYNFDTETFSINLINNTVAPYGSDVEIYVIPGSEYYFVNTQLTITDSSDNAINLEPLLATYNTVNLVSYDSTVFTLTKVAVFTNLLIVESFIDGLKESIMTDNEFRLEYGTTSIPVTVSDIKLNASGILTFAEPPAAGSTVEIYQFSNHDINNFERISYDMIVGTTVDPTTSDYMTRNLLASGFIQLRTPVYSENYAWVIKNGKLLTPNVDYTLSTTRDAIQLTATVLQNDTIEVLQFATNPVTHRFGYRMFKDMIGRTHYKRLNQNKVYTLAAPLHYYDSFIVLNTTSNIFVPDKENNIPGILFINGERIEYFEIQGNILKQLRRGTMGTGVKTVYEIGTEIMDQSATETIKYQDITLSHSISVTETTSFAVLEHVKTQEEIDNGTLLTVNDVEVFLGGVKLRKSSLSKYNPLIAQDSPEADVVLNPDFTILGNNIVLNTIPKAGLTLQVVRRIGHIWNEIGKSLVETDNEITRFILDSTIALPK